MKPIVRWYVSADLPQVLEIEERSFPHAWDKEEFRRWLRCENVAGMIVEIDGRVAGYMIYAWVGEYIELMNLAVHPAYRRRGIGRDLVHRLISKLGVKRQAVELYVSEDNTPAHLFFRAMGFRAVDILRGERDSYRFVFHAQDIVEAEEVPCA